MAFVFLFETNFIFAEDTCGLKKCGDANCDNTINPLDLLIWNKESVGSGGKTADFNNDGNVDKVDYNLLSLGLQKKCSATKSSLTIPIFQKFENSQIKNERDFGYNPNFLPGVVSFDCNNRPYIRIQDSTGKVQILDDNGTWKIVDMRASAFEYVKKHPEIGTWDGKMKDSVNYEDRIVFDNNCYAYTYIDTPSFKDGSKSVGLLLFSKDYGQNWEAYKIPGVVNLSNGNRMAATLEFNSGHNRIIGPPTILIHRLNSGSLDSSPSPYRTNKNLYITKPILNSDKTLTIPEPKIIAIDALLSINHSGGSNNVVTKGSFSYIVYEAENSKEICKQVAGANYSLPNYVVAYDRNTNSTSTPVFIGCAIGGEFTNQLGPDSHGNPAITLDSNGYLHVIIGSHNGHFYYVKSKHTVPTSYAADSSWTEAKKISDVSGYTYISLVSDADNTLHLAARNSNRGGGYSGYRYLVYMQMKKDGIWSTFSNLKNPGDPNSGIINLKHKELVTPWRTDYGAWQQKMTIDNMGNIYLNYSTLITRFTPENVIAYNKKWPEKPLVIKTNCFAERGYCEYKEVVPQDPVLLVSKDKGTNWQLVDANYSWSINKPTPTPKKIPITLTPTSKPTSVENNCNRCSKFYDFMRTVWTAVDCSIDPLASIEVLRTYDANCRAPMETRKSLQCSRCSKVNNLQYTWWERLENKTCEDNPKSDQTIYRAFNEKCRISVTLVPTKSVTLKPTSRSGECVNGKGDANRDGKINLADYAIWRYEYAKGLVSKADFNCDKKVETTDYKIWREIFLETKRLTVSDSN